MTGNCVKMWQALITTLILSASARAEVPASTFTGGGVTILPAQSTAGGFSGAFGQPVVGSGSGKLVWSGLIAPDAENMPSSIDRVAIVGNLNGGVGAILNAPIYVSGAVPFAGFQGTIAFDSSRLEYVGISKGPLVSPDSDWMVEVNSARPAKLNLILSAKETLKAVLPSASLSSLVLQFRVKTAGASSLSFADVTKLAAANGEAIPIILANDNNSTVDVIAPSVSITTPQNGVFLR